MRIVGCPVHLLWLMPTRYRCDGCREWKDGVTNTGIHPSLPNWRCPACRGDVGTVYCKGCGWATSIPGDFGRASIPWCSVCQPNARIPMPDPEPEPTAPPPREGGRAMKRSRWRRNYWVEVYRAPATFYCGLSMSQLRYCLQFHLSLGSENCVTIGPFTVGVDFDFG